jgi:hypothetical protein
MMTKLQWPLFLPGICLAFILVRSLMFPSSLTCLKRCLLLAVPSSTQLLVLSPFIPKYTIHNSYLNVSTTVTTKGFDPRSVKQTIPKNAAAYVSNVTINGVPTASRCHIDFYDIFKTGGDVVIEVTADKSSVDDCGGSLPESLSTGGFSVSR